MKYHDLLCSIVEARILEFISVEFSATALELGVTANC
jgi:hypothetical protein